MKLVYALLFLGLIGCNSGKNTEELQHLFDEANNSLRSAKYEEAIIRYSQVLNENPELVQALNNRGISYMELGYFQKALVDYESALKLDPQYYDAAFNRTNALRGLGRWRPAVKDLEDLALRYDSTAIYFRLGQIYYEQDLLKKAHYAFGEALVRDSSNVENWINRGNMAFYLNDYELALKDINHALGIDAYHPIALNTKALLSLESNDLDQALDYVNQALMAQPNDPYFLNNKGYIFLKMDSLSQAENLINESLLLNSDNPWVFRNKAIWYLKTGAPHQALELLDQLQTLGSYKSVKDYYFYYGEVLWALNRRKEACSMWLQGKDNQEKASISKWEEYCNI